MAEAKLTYADGTTEVVALDGHIRVEVDAAAGPFSRVFHAGSLVAVELTQDEEPTWSAPENAEGDVVGAAGPQGVPVAEADAEGEQTVEERIDGVSSHAEANELAAVLGVEGFGKSKPSLAAKKEALHAKAAEQADTAEEPVESEVE
jgi:hypothetical protein